MIYQSEEEYLNEQASIKLDEQKHYQDQKYAEHIENEVDIINKYYHLKEGDIIKEGDEVEVSNSWRDPAKWVKVKNTIGCKAPNPNFPAHRRYRRLIDTGI